jgi:hypothetical protein
MCTYGHESHAKWFRDAWAKTSKKLDMGKSCIRFKKVEDLALDVIAEAIRRVPAKAYIEHIEATLNARKKPAPKESAKSDKPAPKKSRRAE